MDRNVSTVKGEVIRAMQWGVGIGGAKWNDSPGGKRDVVMPHWVLDGLLALKYATDRLGVMLIEAHHQMGVPVVTLVKISRGANVEKRMEDVFSEVTEKIPDDLYRTLSSNSYLDYISDIEAEDKVRRESNGRSYYQSPRRGIRQEGQIKG